MSLDNSPQNSKLTSTNNTATPNTPSSNHNNNVKTETSLKSGVSLDAAALAKQNMTPTSQNKKYANLSSVEPITSNGVLQSDSFSNHVGAAQKTEINC